MFLKGEGTLVNKQLMCRNSIAQIDAQKSTAPISIIYEQDILNGGQDKREAQLPSSSRL